MSLDATHFKDHGFRPQNAAFCPARMLIPEPESPQPEMCAQPAASSDLRPAESKQTNEQDYLDRRAHPRCTPAELPWVREVRLKYGPRAILINLSEGGAQVETAGYRLTPGSNVVVEIFGDGGESPIPSRVVRCQVVGIAPHLTYRSGLEFKRSLILPAPIATAPSAGVDVNPVHEHARLLLALRRFEERTANPSSESRLTTPADVEIMSAVLAMIDRPAARRAGRTFTHELGVLFSTVSQAIEEDAPTDALIARLLEQLRRTIPVRALRITHSPAVSHSDAVYFEVPSSGNEPAPKLVVEFPRDFRSEEWQFQYLKAAAHFFALVRQIARYRLATTPTTTPTGEEARQRARTIQRVSDGGLATLNPIVVRYLDGRLLKGFTRDFLASRGAVDLWPSQNPSVDSRVSVPFGQLKAVFFVRNLDGDPNYVEPQTSATPTAGRKVAVTFVDGEELTGFTLTYQPGAVGFFVQPLDPRNNNVRVFVVSQAIRHVRFP
jgi:PilZ domain